MTSKTIKIQESSIYSEPTAFHHQVFLDEEFEDRGNYQQLINLLLTAGESDVITFINNHHGGRVEVLFPLINMLEVTAAHTIALCTGSQSSAATIFAMYCDELVALDHASFMIHEMQYGSIGTAANIAKEVEATQRRNRKLMKEAYGGFLNDAEIEQVLSGQEIYLDADEINERWPCRIEWRQKFLDEKQEKMLAKLQEVTHNVPTAEEEVVDTPKPAAKKARKKSPDA